MSDTVFDQSQANAKLVFRTVSTIDGPEGARHFVALRRRKASNPLARKPDVSNLLPDRHVFGALSRCCGADPTVTLGVAEQSFEDDPEAGVLALPFAAGEEDRIVVAELFQSGPLVWVELRQIACDVPA